MICLVYLFGGRQNQYRTFVPEDFQKDLKYK